MNAKSKPTRKGSKRGPRTVAIVLAAGEGVRSGGRKQFREAGGRSVLRHAIDGLVGMREIQGVVVVVPADAVDATRAELDDVDGWLVVVAGGATRHLSSRAGLAALPDATQIVLVHDAARPFASPKMIRRVLRGVREFGAAVPAVGVSDSIVELFVDGGLRRYHDRSLLRAIQTPQGFQRDVIERAFRRTRRKDWTDDASVVREGGRRVEVVEGDPANVKITSLEDLERALRLLAPPATVTPMPKLPGTRKRKA